MIDQQRGNTYLGLNFKDRTLQICEQNAEAFFVRMKFIVDHAVFTEKQKGNQIPTMDTHIYIYIYYIHTHTHTYIYYIYIHTYMHFIYTHIYIYILDRHHKFKIYCKAWRIYFFLNI